MLLFMHGQGAMRTGRCVGHHPLLTSSLPLLLPMLRQPEHKAQCRLFRKALSKVKRSEGTRARPAGSNEWNGTQNAALAFIECNAMQAFNCSALPHALTGSPLACKLSNQGMTESL